MLLNRLKTYFTGSPLRRELSRHAGGTFALKVIGLVLQLASGVALARLLGTTGYGIYSYPMAIVGLLSVPATAGLPQLIMRETSKYNANAEFGLMKGLLIRANQFVLFLSVFLLIITMVVFLTIGHGALSTASGKTFLLAMLLLPLLSLNHVRLAALRGLRKILLGQIPDILIRPLVFLSILSFSFFVFHTTISPQVAISVQIVATIFAFCLGSCFLFRYQPQEVKSAHATYDTKLWAKSALPFLFLGLAQIVNMRIDIVMLGIFRPIEEVGIYKTVTHGATLVVFVLAAVNIAIGPQVARLWAQGNKHQLQKMVTASTRVIAIGTLLFASILFFGAEFFLAYFFGEEFVAGATTLRILCLGQIVNGLAGSVGLILNMTGHEKQSAHAVYIAAMVNVALNLLLIPQIGINGAAIATAVSLSTTNIILILWVKKYTGIYSTVLGSN